MKKNTFISFLILVGAVYFAFTSQMPDYHEDEVIPIEQFGTKRALIHLKEITKKPHYCGTTAHTEVRKYIVHELEKLGLKVEIQEEEAVNNKWQSGVKTFNILTRIKGTGNGKALLLLSHYDSTPHSSFGGSDAGSGVVTILETLRAYIASGAKPKNDIIILISDAEELGLLGARAFVKHHPWAKDVKLVLNLEARGSGGPSYMLLETNGGNHNFIEAFQKAQTPYPVSNSLMYSIYKMLPNDTDLTIFREDADIDGFNFAFIDDFYDYHTALDTYERLDPEVLKQQGSYYSALLDFFSKNEISNLKGEQDDVFFNFPYLGLVHYPFQAVLPSIILVSLLFLGLFVFVVMKKKIRLRESLIGFVPYISALIISFLLGTFGWKFILYLFPQYKDMLQGFPYNSYQYIVFFISLTLGLLFYVYDKYVSKGYTVSELSIAPTIILILINIVIASKLKGGGFFILLLIVLLTSWSLLVLSKPNKNNNLLIPALLAVPVLLVFSPLTVMFPVGLGMKAIGVSLVLVVFIFGSLLGVLGQFPKLKLLSKLFFGIAVVFFIKTYSNSDYSIEDKQPTGVVYIADEDNNEAFFASYNTQNDDFTKQFLGENPNKGDLSMSFSSKFQNGLNLYNKTEKRDIPFAQVTKTVNDSMYENKSMYRYHIVAQRKTNLFYIASKKAMNFNNLSFNGELYNSITLSTDEDNKKVMGYYLADGTSELVLEFELNKGEEPELELLDISYDLMSHPEFDFTPRGDTMMPMPFIFNDAIILKKKI